VGSKGQPWRLAGVRIALLLALLVAATVLLVDRVGGLDLGGGEADAGGDCPGQGAPQVETTDRARVFRLREDVRWIVPDGSGITAYEQGPVDGTVAWTDGEPGWNTAPDPDAPLPAGYEMRWWMPSRDDVVADALMFSDPGQARDYVERASSAGCRPPGNFAAAAPFPPRARNLYWVNPDGYAQEDVFLSRGRLVYWVSVVLAGAGPRAGAAERRHGFEVVDALACALPGAACRAAGPGPVSA
jgi:hypothetical protein